MTMLFLDLTSSFGGFYGIIIWYALAPLTEDTLLLMGVSKNCCCSMILLSIWGGFTTTFVLFLVDDAAVFILGCTSSAYLRGEGLANIYYLWVV